jgi:sulfur carrier protein
MYFLRSVMDIIINGENRSFKNKITVQELLKEIGLDNKPIVIELNQEVVIKENYNLELSPNDKLEIVTFVGGG